ncbi:DUF11 domain-containing protein [filamentous cyanobacterium LEGE 11480]|uniref:DUF11 domain-containing protein n=1 Tax=Romeriopsis navalis LEGE 11480 TaxID=2777977 RepID=A0A928VLC1_9CYAN|nr:hypothetical protein [Romeriopsis navalis]MBE9029843.1 DUF11 domain-containing protein [Romeriopsis navalis LEGE 11480]
MLFRTLKSVMRRSRSWQLNPSVEQRWLLLIFLAPSLAILPASAQNPTTVSNTASGSFGDPLDPNGTPTSTNSNTVPLDAVLGRSSLELIKTGDRAAAAPGDTAIYRLLLRNTGTITVNNLTLSDRLPLGMQFLQNSVQAAINTGNVSSAVSLNVNRNGQDITFQYPSTLAPQQDLAVVYAVELTPDALRGSGRNLASGSGNTATQTVQTGVASHQMRISSGILSDCGTLIGRVFEDKNFDGKQQATEPGMPNAVVFMDDGNRVTTDIEGKFSLTCVLPGPRTGVLDMTSVAGYTLAPNEYKIQDNSQSRMVMMSPGSLRRMDFGVVPAAMPETPEAVQPAPVKVVTPKPETPQSVQSAPVDLAEPETAPDAKPETLPQRY